MTTSVATPPFTAAPTFDHLLADSATSDPGGGGGAPTSFRQLAWHVTCGCAAVTAATLVLATAPVLYLCVAVTTVAAIVWATALAVGRQGDG